MKFEIFRRHSHPRMDRYRYFIFNQKIVVLWGILQVACAGICVVCGFMDAVFRKSTTLSKTRAPLWAGLIMAVPGVLALFASQKKNPILVNAMIVSSVVSHIATVIVLVYAGVTLNYGEEDDELFQPHHIPEVKFVLSRMVKAANSTMVLASVGSLLFSSLIAFVGCRSLPLCGCYDPTTGMDLLVPQNEQSASAELVCSWHGEPDAWHGLERSVHPAPRDELPSSTIQLITRNRIFEPEGDERVFNSPLSLVEQCPEQEQENASVRPPYSRLA